MKYLSIILICLIIGACASKNAQEKPISDSLQTIELLQGAEETITIQIPESSSLLNVDEHSQHSLLYGRLTSGSSLHFGKQTIMMTTISMQEAVSPESGFLAITAEQEGSWAIVEGHLAGDLYEAEIICVFSEAPTQKQWQAFRRGTANFFDACQ